jgi:hypothetical protein
MADTLNPWQGPSAEAGTEEAVFRGAVTPLMVRYLKETSPWLLFVGVLGYVAAVLLGLVGLILGIVMVFALRAPGRLGSDGAVVMFMGPAYLAAGALAFFPARFTHKCGLRIRRYLVSAAEGDLEEALRNNRALWRFSGILSIVYLALLILVIIGAVGSAVLAFF